MSKVKYDEHGNIISIEDDTFKWLMIFISITILSLAIIALSEGI